MQASTGQTSAHSPQPVQVSSTDSGDGPPGLGWAALSGFGRMACSGQVRRQAPQPAQAVVTMNLTVRTPWA
jgi:hypothetical protein